MNESFSEIFRGHLQGIMNEDAYVKMAKSLENESVVSGTWFAICFPTDLSKKKSTVIIADLITANEVGKKLLELFEEVRQRKSISGKFPHTYVKNRENPSFIKLYDPKKCGGSCSTVAPAPWWVFSKVKPTPEELEKIFPEK